MPSLQANQLYHHRMRTVSGDRPGILNLQLLLFEPISVENSPQGNEDIDVSVNHLLQVARICRFPIRIRDEYSWPSWCGQLLDTLRQTQLALGQVRASAWCDKARSIGGLMAL